MIENLDADRLLAGPLGQWLAEQEAPRREAVAKSNKRLLVSAVIAAGVLWFIFKDGLEAAGFLFVLAPFTVIGLLIWAWWPRWTAAQKVKVGINEAIADSVGISYSLNGDPNPAYNLLAAYKMLPGHNRQKFEDFWEGDLAGHHFRLFEAHLEQHSTDSDGKSRTVTKFRGPFLSVGCSVPFRSTTILHRAGAKKRFGFFGGKADEITANGKQLAAVDMVHPDFEDAFDVYSTDQVEARNLVHPSYIERLIAIENAFKGSKLRALFCDGQITVMLEAKNMFESGSLSAAKDRGKLEETLGQFRSLAELAIELNRR